MNHNMHGYNKDITTQMEMLEQIIRSSEKIYQVLQGAEKLNLKNYYIGAGCISQTVWNYLSGNELLYGISDIDLVYYDEEHLDYDSENDAVVRAENLFSDIDLKIDLKNEARVHLWYASHFGYEIDPYTSVEDAINTWPTTATAVGIRLENGRFTIYAPYGLNDLFGKIIRANRGKITKEVYENKVAKWSKKWPDLNIIPWED